MLGLELTKWDSHSHQGSKLANASAPDTHNGVELRPDCPGLAPPGRKSMTRCSELTGSPSMRASRTRCTRRMSFQDELKIQAEDTIIRLSVLREPLDLKDEDDPTLRGLLGQEYLSVLHRARRNAVASIPTTLSNGHPMGRSTTA